jgi:hypothetical protein
MLLAVIVQAALFLPMRDIAFDLSPTDTPMLVTLALQALEDGADPGSAAEARTNTETPEPERKLTTRVEPGVGKLMKDVQTEPQPSSPSDEAPQLAMETSAPEVVPIEPEPAFEPSPNAISESRETRPMPDAQRSMLQRKFERLAEQIDDLKASGTRVVWEHEGQEYTAVLTKIPARDSMEIDEILVEVSTEKGGARLTSDMRMKRLAFSNFVQFVDRWDGEVVLHDDEFDGRFHSNEKIPVGRSADAQPVFHATVTTAEGVDTSVSKVHVRRSEVFLAGVRTWVRKITLPRRFVPFPHEAPPEAHEYHELDEDTRITFHADGTYSWSSGSSGEQRRRLPQDPYYIIGSKHAELSLKGVVNGKVLVYARRKIVIEDDLTYASDPMANADSDDFLGLVSDGNVEIADPETTGPGDLRVQAAIYATRQFTVRHYRARQDATLFIDGSLIAGYLSATEPRFRTKMQFDRRLENLRPPAFPVTDRFEVADESGLWTVESNGS